jgi:hypothetical protein
MGYIFLFGVQFSAQWQAARERAQEMDRALESRRSA